MNKRIGIIGAGVVGTAVAVVLSQKGYEITGIYDIKPESTKQLVEMIGSTTCLSPQDVSKLSDIIFISTSDTAIDQVISILADHGAIDEGQVFIHMSGAQSAQIMDRVKEFGARVLSVHPLQSFPNLEMAIQNLPGSVFSIEGDKDAYDIAVCLVETMKGEYFFIDRKAKPLYHAGACVVSNYLVTLIDFGVKLLESSGIPPQLAVKALIPLINGTVNNIESIGIPTALTGPIARGDISTILNHINCLEEMNPEMLKLYSWLGFYTAKIALEKGSIDCKIMEDLQKLFIKELSRKASAS